MLLLGGTSTTIVERFKKVLDLYLNALGGKVDKGKNHIYSWNLAPLLMQSIA